MKKLFLFVTMIAIGLASASAQDNEKKFGIRVGVNLSNVVLGGESGLIGHDPSWLTGYLGGITYDSPVTDVIYVFSSLDAVQKGFKYEDKGGGFEESISYASLFGQLALHLGAKVDVGLGQFIIHAGPFVGYGITGKIKSKFTYGGETETESEDIYSEDSDIKRLDYGLGLAAGLDVGMFAVTLGYDHGFANLYDSDHHSIKSQSLYLAVGLKF